MIKLSLRDIGKRYGDVAAVEGFDLDLAAGEFVSLLGPSGCGKTTTLRMIAGFIDPTSGSIEMDGRVLSSPSGSLPPERRQMSMIFQSYAVWPNMTVAENVAFGLKLRKIPGPEVARQVLDMLDVVQMRHLAERYPSELSGGQQQRVALARAIVIKPQVLLLDEPLSNLDANLREEMRFEIRRLHDEFRITTVYVTHDQAEAMVTSDRIAVMNLGRIEQVDDPHTLYTRPKTRFVAGFIGRTNFLEGTRRGGDIVFDRFAVPASALESPDRAPQERLDRSPQESLVRSPQESLDRSPQESLVRSPPESQNGASDKITFSVRPQSMRLHRMESDAASGRIGVAVKIAERAYLGEFWDYMVVPREGSLRLRVTAPPPDVYAVGEAAWLELDPKQMAPIA